jgi:hypothetical protein
MLKLYIPKQCLPGLLRTILEKDFGPSIRSGFESTGLCPLNMERALAKLPHAVAPDGNLMSAVQQHLINRLASLRYNPPLQPSAHQTSPEAKEKKTSCPQARPTSALWRTRTQLRGGGTTTSSSASWTRPETCTSG